LIFREDDTHLMTFTPPPGAALPPMPPRIAELQDDGSSSATEDAVRRYEKLVGYYNRLVLMEHSYRNPYS